jgi:cobalt-zinc-cadmium efflux system outer membrane protein
MKNRINTWGAWTVVLCTSYALPAQPVLTVEEAVAAARQNHPSLKAAALATEQARQAERGAILLPQPELSVENPEGERYTVGIDQSLEWPGLYRAERALARQQTVLIGLEQTVVSNELTYQVRQIYLEWQYAQSRFSWYQVQDTLYQAARLAADRQFRAGEIDFMKKTYAETQYTAQRLALLQAEADRQRAWQQLQLLTGLDGPRQPEALPAAPVVPAATESNPALVVAQAAIQREQLNVRAAQQRKRPGFTVGYFNQAGPENLWYNRFRAGITLPIWQGAYNRRLEAARTGVAVAEQQLAAQQLDLELQRREAAANLEKWQAALTLYRQSAQPQARELRDSARRFFEAGEISFTDYLRIVADANAFDLNYIDALYEFNRVNVTLQYLNGNP